MKHSIPTFEQSLVKSNQWLYELKQVGDFNSVDESFDVLKAVLHSLRDRLFPSEAILLAAEMPMLIRGMYFEGWNPTHLPSKDSFLVNVQELLDETHTEVNAREAIRIVFKFLKAKILAGEIEDIQNNLPEEILSYWKDTELA